ncbi:MAG: bifunctional serine/threonine-protein kinase/formylglycine-generating enzyme family protein [Pseudomonadota bacterium]
MFRAGEVLGGDFEIREPLSQGGMGAVFLARQISTDTLRAIKVMLPEWSQREELRVRFEQEAKVSGRIPSEHVVKIIAYGIDPARHIPWLAMEYLRGTTLEERLARVGAPPPPAMAEILRQLFHGISAAHALGIVHRDLKPANVFLADSQRADTPFTVKVLDFGIAKILGREPSVTQAMGTHAWKAPEQDHAGMVISPAADVWALGLLVFWLLQGRSFWRFVDDAPSRLSYEVHFEAIPSASERIAERAGQPLGADFDAWFSHCVNRDPAQRFADARACWHALERILTGWGMGNRSSSPWLSAPITTARMPQIEHPAPAPQQATRSVLPESARTTQPAQLDIAPVPARAPRRSSVRRALVLVSGAASLLAVGFMLRDRLVPRAMSKFPAPSTSAVEASASPARRSSSDTNPPPVAPSGMLYVPPGEFEMGDKDLPAQGPERHVRISRGFFIDRTEVTARDYSNCVAQARCTPSGVHGPSPELDDSAKYGKYCNADRAGRELHPINCIDRGQALGYCRFLGKRLPSEAEWEYSARGSDGRRYPWGNAPPSSCSMGVISGLCPATGTQPAGSRAASSQSPFGALDMSGNVWEWVADGWEVDPGRLVGDLDPLVPGTAGKGVLRGGSWDFAPSHATTTRRLPIDVSEGHVSMGVRCARDL